MATALVGLATTTLASPSSTITFSSIPATYRDLVIVCSMDISANIITIYLNGDTTWGNYSRVAMIGNGSTASSSSASDPRIMEASGMSNFTVNLFDYSATDKHKVGISRNNSAAMEVRSTAFRWANTAAVTSVQLASSFPVGTTMSLYGVLS